MRVTVVLIATFLATASPSSAQTRWEADSADRLRHCTLQREPNESADQYAIRCAERFLVEQGYTNSSPTADTNRIVPEGIEWSVSKVEWLAGRRGSLDPQASGVCVGSAHPRYSVVFRRSHGGGARGVTLDAAFGSLRVQHEDFRFEVLKTRQYGCRPLPARRQQ
jgi:hypothetical protein